MNTFEQINSSIVYTDFIVLLAAKIGCCFLGGYTLVGVVFQALDLALDVCRYLFSVTFHAFVAFHLLGVHSADAVVRAVTAGVVMRVLLDMVDEVRILDEDVCQLEEFESLVHNALTAVTRLHATDVDKNGSLVVGR